MLIALFGAAVLLTRDGEVLKDAPRDRPDLGLPAEGLTASDLSDVRLGMVVRGYRMAEVDEVLDRAAVALAERDARLAALQARLSGGPGADPETDPETDPGAEPLPEVHRLPGAEPAGPVPFRGPVHVDEPVDVPPPAGDPDREPAQRA